MNLLHSTKPILRRKQRDIYCQEYQSLVSLYLKIAGKTLYSGLYSCLDQVFIIWGLIVAAIFVTAQFLPISWTTQAIVWSILTLAGTLSMMILTHFWVKQQQLNWILYLWVMLMVSGVILTDCSIFLGWGWLLIHLSHLWLGLCSLGYIITALGLSSRALLLVGLGHLLGIFSLPYVMGWEFLATAGIMVVSLLVLAETQWDHS
ncbi:MULTISPECIES: hypothetical protein [Crocosphaera]|uniref:Uncharacterized protein n=6 Tax=Crocosphaera watsonii TaxID=263511 RepID=Q4C468_CROWT|nr:MULTISPECIES: hypothetical protein [Crocosphaera]EAM50963.1 hypothetical protein CwatDRAFT_4133 [Crocosphaera watsonii WH 8501]EHJ12893.1 hypothetical protein CWATWH0003_2418 [Crocosphaera watsonii WH 0003]MCH2243903.1 hypothetical protein [Crocosphaera sp.]NQZ61389.1 hypothetical protein [Crocosphaera sp.]CCQ48883.1 FIG00570668: hypothetical protein [Crocosphaera watsonii WH 8502]